MKLHELIASLKSECDTEDDEVRLASRDTTWEILSIYYAPEDGFVWIDIEGDDE